MAPRTRGLIPTCGRGVCTPARELRHGRKLDPCELWGGEGHDSGQAVPGGEIYPNFPGLGARLAAKIGGEIGNHFEQFRTPSSLLCHAGTAPVTRRSGKLGQMAIPVVVDT